MGRVREKKRWRKEEKWREKRKKKRSAPLRSCSASATGARNLSLNSSEEASFKLAIHYLGDLSAEETNTVYACLLSLAPPHAPCSAMGSSSPCTVSWPR
jgi:hypothetical protein